MRPFSNDSSLSAFVTGLPNTAFNKENFLSKLRSLDLRDERFSQLLLVYPLHSTITPLSFFRWLRVLIDMAMRWNKCMQLQYYIIACIESATKLLQSLVWRWRNALYCSNRAPITSWKEICSHDLVNWASTCRKNFNITSMQPWKRRKYSWVGKGKRSFDENFSATTKHEPSTEKISIGDRHWKKWSPTLRGSPTAT